MPGVGKTTLAKKVYNSMKAKFQCSAWVYISQEPKLRDLLQDIARQVGLKKELREENLEANLFNFLKERRYVIVIDDIWDVKAWDALKNGIPNICENQSRLVLTSRHEEVGLCVGGSSSLHELHPLSPEKSWELFFSLVFKTPAGNTDQELMDLGKQILEKCGGLPLSIVTIAGLLSTKRVTEREWRGVLNKMGQENNEICALSYRDLPTKLKSCFLYFGIFPEGKKIIARDLIHLWVAEGLIQSQERQTLEDAGEDYLDELISRNLIQVEKRGYDGRIKYCRIHDVLRDLCILIAREEGFFTTLRGNDSVTAMELRRAAIHLVSVYNGISSHQFPKLRTLLCFNIEINHIHKGFKLLRVLYLEGLAASGVSLTEIGNLIHLRYLRLRGEYLILPATMANLKNLQVLDCQHCISVILPTAIWKMDKLRHVYIPSKIRSVRQLKKVEKVVEEVSLPNLETLYHIGTDILNANCLFQLTNLKNLGLFGSLEELADILKNTTPISEKLEKFHLVSVIYATYDSDLPTLNFACYQNLLKLYLKGPVGEMPVFSRSLTKLTLLGTRLRNDPMKELGMLPSLRVLKLQYYSYLGKVMVTSGPNSFPSLEILIIDLLYTLRILRVEGGDGVMPKLQKVRINPSVTLYIQSERLKRIFQGFNYYDPEDDSYWEDDDSILEENEFMDPATEVTNKAKELITDEGTQGEITETPKRFFELGECSSQVMPPT